MEIGSYNPSVKIKHSILGKLAFAFSLTPLINLFLVIHFWEILFASVFLGFAGNIFIISALIWIIILPLSGFVLSIIDLIKPKRLKILPIISLILCSIFLIFYSVILVMIFILNINTF